MRRKNQQLQWKWSKALLLKGWRARRQDNDVGLWSWMIITSVQIT